MKDSELCGENLIQGSVCVRNLEFMKNVFLKNLSALLTYSNFPTSLESKSVSTKFCLLTTKRWIILRKLKSSSTMQSFLLSSCS